MAQKPLPTSALLAGAAMTSFPSPLPVGSHPLEAIPKERVDILQDKLDDLRNEMEEVKAEMRMLKGKAGEAGVKNDDGKEKSNNAGHIVMSNKEKAVTESDWSYEESRSVAERFQQTNGLGGPQELKTNHEKNQS